MSLAEFVVSSVDFEEPRRISTSKLLAHLKTSCNWPEAPIHHPTHQYPIMDMSFTGAPGFRCLLRQSHLSRLFRGFRSQAVKAGRARVSWWAGHREVAQGTVPFDLSREERHLAFS
jgi:hypothetical protein